MYTGHSEYTRDVGCVNHTAQEISYSEARKAPRSNGPRILSRPANCTPSGEAETEGEDILILLPVKRAVGPELSNFKGNFDVNDQVLLPATSCSNIPKRETRNQGIAGSIRYCVAEGQSRSRRHGWNHMPDCHQYSMAIAVDHETLTFNNLNVQLR